VALLGDRAILGAYGENSYRGAAYVFVRSDGVWSEQQKLVASDGALGDNFGWSVSLVADRAVVGAFAHDTSRGAAYVFVRDGDVWTEEQKLLSNEGAEGDNLGYSVSLGDDRVLVGAPGHDRDLGAAHVFARDGSVWTEEERLVASDGVRGDGLAVPGDHLGVSVSLAGDRALLGAYFKDELRGAAYLFARSDGGWTEEQKLVPSDGASGDRFGGATALRSDRALIGAFGAQSARGAAYAFVRSGDSFDEEHGFLASDGIDGDLFGWSVSLTDDQAVVGAQAVDNLRGGVYAFALGPETGAGGPDGGPDPIENGSFCATDEACESGHCVDGVCCDTACGGTCEACTQVLKGEGEDGTCGPVARGLNPLRSSADPSWDCAENLVCAAGQCVSDAPANAPSGNAGCGCRSAGSATHSRGFFLLTMLALLFVAGRRPRRAPILRTGFAPTARRCRSRTPCAHSVAPAHASSPRP
jgi:MYXO-CTERM domain-containing protein